MMTKTLKWRLQELPSGGEIADLVSEGVITKEEAREILFSTPKDDKDDIKSLKSEINFLRELVEKLSSRTNYYPMWQTFNTAPYRGYGWFQTYSSNLGTQAPKTTSNLGVVYSQNANNLVAASSALTLPRYQ